MPEDRRDRAYVHASSNKLRCRRVTGTVQTRGRDLGLIGKTSEPVCCCLGRDLATDFVREDGPPRTKLIDLTRPKTIRILLDP